MVTPSIRSVKLTYDKLNRTMFNGLLPPSCDLEFEVRPLRGKWGCCGYEFSTDSYFIVLTDKFPSRHLYESILAHEMVHVFQHMFTENMAHGPSFYAWRQTFQENGLHLRRCY